MPHFTPDAKPAWKFCKKTYLSDLKLECEKFKIIDEYIRDYGVDLSELDESTIPKERLKQIKEIVYCKRYDELEKYEFLNRHDPLKIRSLFAEYITVDEESKNPTTDEKKNTATTLCVPQMQEYHANFNPNSNSEFLEKYPAKLTFSSLHVRSLNDLIVSNPRIDYATYKEMIARINPPSESTNQQNYKFDLEIFGQNYNFDFETFLAAHIKNEEKEWNMEIVSAHRKINIEHIKKYRNIDWDYRAFSLNPNFNWKIMCEIPLHICKTNFSKNPNVTIITILLNRDFKWCSRGLAANKNITPAMIYYYGLNVDLRDLIKYNSNVKYEDVAYHKFRRHANFCLTDYYCNPRICMYPNLLKIFMEDRKKMLTKLNIPRSAAHRRQIFRNVIISYALNGNELMYDDVIFDLIAQKYILVRKSLIREILMHKVRENKLDLRILLYCVLPFVGI